MSFTLRQLAYFVATVELGSFRAAALESQITETALAQAISDLESTLGQSLFIRKRSRGVTSTPEALTLLPLARSMLDQANELTTTANNLRSELAGPLRVGCYSTLSPFIVPSLIADFVRPHPRLELSIVEDDPFALQHQLLEGKLDCVLLQKRQAMPNVATHSLRFGEPRVLLSAAHPLASHDRVALADLVAEPMVLLDVPAVRGTLLPMLDEIGIQPVIGWRSTIFETVRSLVARNLGWSVLIHHPPSAMSYEGLPLVSIRIREAIASSDVSLGILRGRRTNARILAFTRHCREYFERIDSGKSVATAREPISPRERI